MNNKILFYCEKMTPRVRYTVQSIVGNLLAAEFIFTHDKEQFSASELPKINYSWQQLADKEIIIQPQALLFEDTIQHFDIDIYWDFFANKDSIKKGRKPVESKKNAFNLDIFASIFYLVSRYEEYTCQPSKLDVHGRFPASESLAGRTGFLQYPLVNDHVNTLAEHLKDVFPNIQLKRPTFAFQPTFDIDMAWLYRNKGFLRTISGFLKDFLKGKFDDIKKRLAVFKGVVDDPIHNFDYIRQLHQAYGKNFKVFWLLGDLGKFDKNIAWENPEFQALIRSFAHEFTVGIHPSYRSNSSVLILEKEVGRLKEILTKSAKNAFYTEGSFFPSRQHFLKLSFPETYRRLIAVGILEDWSMGFADDTGFRASIATPFPWFDLEKNEETALIIHPFQAMDVTLNQYLKLTPEEATERLRVLIRITKEVGGTFTTLWHNDNLTEIGAWKGWKKVYEQLLKDAI
jgi:hypothetical protein